MNIAILLYDGVTALDAIGPYEVLACMPDADVHFVAKKPGVITTHTGVPGLHADMALSDMPAPDIFLYAAKGMGYKPEQCVVIEDSIAGIKAAKAAGMRVFNYTGDANADIEQAKTLGAVTFGHMSELPALLGLKSLDETAV